jgi:hypothetical protein
MKILLISERSAPPEALGDIIQRGSTAIEHRRASEIDPQTALRKGADRIVFWHEPGDTAVSGLARMCAAAASPDRRHTIVFVMPTDADAPEGLSANELFLWPGDEDRLRMAFMTGA